MRMITGLLEINISVSVMIRRHKLKIRPGFPCLNKKSYQKYSVTKLNQVAIRAVDLRSALGPSATFLYNKCKKGLKVSHK